MSSAARMRGFADTSVACPASGVATAKQAIAVRTNEFFSIVEKELVPWLCGMYCPAVRLSSCPPVLLAQMNRGRLERGDHVDAWRKTQFARRSTRHGRDQRRTAHVHGYARDRSRRR